MSAQARCMTVLHVPYTYFPDSAGGTEVYVRNLAQALRRYGYASSVAAPGRMQGRYDECGVPVYRFRGDARNRLDRAYGAPDEVAAEQFRAIVDEVRPAIVHLHARSAAVSDRLCDIAQAAGARVVFTYHTPAASCARGTMMLYGKEPCDGMLRRRRCVACALAAHGLPRALGLLSASIPDRLAERLAAADEIAGSLRRLRIPALIGQDQTRFHSLMAKVDHVVALCGWVRELLSRNGVPAEKISISRHGITIESNIRPTPPYGEWHRQEGPLRIAYFGRLDPAKGPDFLARAIAAIAGAPVRLDLFAVPENVGLGSEIATRIASDPRMSLHDPVAPETVQQAMAEYDLIAVPSLCLETGPLVVLEAFAAGVPVLGSDLGGIAESVRDGIDGVLVEPGNVGAWSAAILRLTQNRGLLRGLRQNIRPPRGLNDMARDMAHVYNNLLGRDCCHESRQ